MKNCLYQKNTKGRAAFATAGLAFENGLVDSDCPIAYTDRSPFSGECLAAPGNNRLGRDGILGGGQNWAHESFQSQGERRYGVGIPESS